LEPDLIRSENRVRLAKAAINNLIMADLEAPVRIEAVLEYRPWPVGTLEEIQRHALDQRPEVHAAQKQLQQAKLMTSLANAENKISVDMEGQWGYSVRQPQKFFNNDFSSWNLTVNFKLPVFDSGKKNGLVRQASARVRTAEQRLAQLENNVRLEIKQAYDDMRSAAQAINAAKLSVSQAEKVLNMMQSNYQYGAATTLDVTDSQTALSLARNSQIGATYEYEIAKARLRLASGVPILDGEGKQ
jgi:outer membrane protein TolC